MALKKMKQKIDGLKYELSTLAERFNSHINSTIIGEVYQEETTCFSTPYYPQSPLQQIVNSSIHINWHWRKITCNQVQEQINNHIKIDNKWHDKKNVIFYDEIWNKKRKEIERRIKNASNRTQNPVKK